MGDETTAWLQSFLLTCLMLLCLVADPLRIPPKQGPAASGVGWAILAFAVAVCT